MPWFREALTMALSATFACVLVLCPPPADAAPRAPAEALAALAQRYYDDQARLDPVYSATLTGDNRFDDQLPLTLAPAQRQKRFAMYHAVERRLSSIARDRLSPGDALTYDLLARDLRSRIGFEAFPDHLLPVQQMDCIPVLLATFGGGQAEQPLKTVAQYDAYLKRISRLPAWVQQAIANMRTGVQQGIVQPRAVIAASLGTLRPLAVADLASNPFYAPIRNLPASFPEADRRRLSQAYGRAVTQKIAPALAKLTDYLSRQYLDAARGTDGWSALPNGDAWYRQWVRDQTTTTLGPDEIHAIGLKEVARIQGELARVAPRLGYDGDPRQLLG